MVNLVLYFLCIVKVTCLTYEVGNLVGTEFSVEMSIVDPLFAYDEDYDVLVMMEVLPNEGDPGNMDISISSFNPPSSILFRDEVTKRGETVPETGYVNLLLDYDPNSKLLACVFTVINSTRIFVYEVQEDGTLHELYEKYDSYETIGYHNVMSSSCFPCSNCPADLSEPTSLFIFPEEEFLYITFVSYVCPDSSVQYLTVVGFSLSDGELYITDTFGVNSDGFGGIDLQNQCIFVRNSEPYLVAGYHAFHLTSSVSEIKRNWTLWKGEVLAGNRMTFCGCLDNNDPMMCVLGRYPSGYRLVMFTDEPDDDTNVWWTPTKTTNYEFFQHFSLHEGEGYLGHLAVIFMQQKSDWSDFVKFSYWEETELSSDSYIGRTQISEEDEDLPQDTDFGRFSERVSDTDDVTYFSAQGSHVKSGYANIYTLKYSVCPRGFTYSNVSVSPGRCEPCEDGFVDTPAGDVCQRCPTGHFINESTFGECSRCQVGYFSNDGQICRPCPPGSYSMIPGAVECVRCPTGMFGTREGQTQQGQACESCPEGMVCNTGCSNPLSVDTPERSSEFSINFYDFDSSAVFVGEQKRVYESTTFWKILFSVLLLLLSLCFLQIPCCCQCCPKRCIFVDNCCHFVSMDHFYALKHSVKKGQSPVKEPTTHGGICSMVAIMVSVVLIVISTIGFLMDNRFRSSTMRLYIDQRHDDFVGDFEVTTLIYGPFTTCESDCSTTVNLDISNAPIYTPFSGRMTTESFFNDRVDQGLFSDEACVCRWRCQGCDFSHFLGSENSYLQFDWQLNSRYVNMIMFNISVPHYNPNEFFVATGMVSEVYESISGLVVKSSILKTKIRRYSLWNYFTSVLGIQRHEEKEGVASTIKSSTKTVGSPVNVGNIRIYFEVSEMMMNDVERLEQTTINFIAQIFALFSFSIALVGCFFKVVDDWIIRLCSVCCFLPRTVIKGKKGKKKKNLKVVQDPEKEKGDGSVFEDPKTKFSSDSNSDSDDDCEKRQETGIEDEYFKKDENVVKTEDETKSSSSSSEQGDHVEQGEEELEDCHDDVFNTNKTVDLELNHLEVEKESDVD